MNVAKIDGAKNFHTAMSLTTHSDRLAYIEEKRGKRATGGRFTATKANVLDKFARIWSEETGKPNSRTNA